MDSSRPEKFRFDIASGVLESLGLNMYTSIGKSLSEFVANAHDADAGKVEITIPFEEIAAARAAIRDQAKQEVQEGKRDKFKVLVDPLPEEVRIVVRDTGHGMSPQDIESKFLIVSRNRRSEGLKSESGLRFVMGRKGLGKLAGFGTAERITIRSKRAGESFATEFTMDYSEIEHQAIMNQNFFAANYIEDCPVEDHGTTITLSGLRCDSLKATEDTVRSVLAQNFAILNDTFEVLLNEVRIEEEPAEHEFFYPDESNRDDEGFGEHRVVVNDMLEFPIKYLVRFRARETDGAQAVEVGGRVLKRGHLPASLRGARIYCNRRLAAGPSLLNLPTGMHNFHAQAYMECIVHADEIDRHAIDHIGTNRADLKGDSDVVEALKEAVTGLMRQAIYEHSKYRDSKTAKDIDEDEYTQGLLVRISGQPSKTRTATKKLLQTLAANTGVKSELYRQAAPLVLESMNAGEVLTNLINLAIDPTSLPIITNELFELAGLESRDALKLFRARRNGIEALRKLVERADESWGKKRFEKDLHKLLKENPWLIKPEFSRFLTSDRPLGEVAKDLASHLGIDEHAPALKTNPDGEISDEDTRPDLVFAMTDPASSTTVTIVELKTPNLPLKAEHLYQLEGYMAKVTAWLNAKYSGQQVKVRGILIGDMQPGSRAEGVEQLNYRLQQAGPLTPWEVIPLRELIDRAKRVHQDAIEALEKDVAYYDEENSTEQPGN